MSLVLDFFVKLTEENGIWWMIGQGFGIVAIILGFISYQLRTKRQLLYMQTVVAFVFCIHYLLIGAYSATAMNFVNIIRNFAYDYRTNKNIRGKLIPIIFVVIQAIMCALTWDAWYSVFVLLGICINTYCMSNSNAQFVRKSILLTSPLVMTYDLFARSVGGTIYEAVALTSSAIGLARNARAKKEGNQEPEEIKEL